VREAAARFQIPPPLKRLDKLIAEFVMNEPVPDLRPSQWRFIATVLLKCIALRELAEARARYARSHPSAAAASSASSSADYPPDFDPSVHFPLEPSGPQRERLVQWLSASGFSEWHFNAAIDAILEA